MSDPVKTFCTSHEQMVKDVTEIKTSVVEIKSYIQDGKLWRMTLAASVIAVALVLLCDLIIVANLWGSLNKTVEVNSVRITTLEEIHPRK